MNRISLLIMSLSIIALGPTSAKADHHHQSGPALSVPAAPRTAAIQHAPHPAHSAIQHQQRANRQANTALPRPQPSVNANHHEEHHHDRNRTTVIFYPYPIVSEPFVPDTYYDDSSNDNSSYTDTSNDNVSQDNSSYSNSDNSVDPTNPDGNWVTVQNGSIPDNAISYQENNGTVYYCRALYNNQLYYGRLTDACYVEDKANAATIRLTVYDVLVK